MRELFHPAREELSLPAVLYALSDPIRLRIVRELAANGERACGTFGLPLAKATVSHHFKVLRETGVIRMRREGTQTLNTLRRADLDARFPGLLDAILQAAATDAPAAGAASRTAPTREPVPAAAARG